MQAADTYEAADPGIAQLRREQAQALADAYGFDADVSPREVSEALAARADQ